MRLYTDDGSDGPEYQQSMSFQELFAKPMYLIVDLNSGNVTNQLVGYSDKKEFQQFLDAGFQQLNNKKDHLKLA